MTGPFRIFTYLLVVTVVCLLAMCQHERNSANSAKEESAELRTRVENLDGDLATIKEQFNQLEDAYSATLLTSVPAPRNLAEAMSRMAQLDAQRSNTLSFMHGLGNAIKQRTTAEGAQLGQQEALAELTTSVATQKERVAAAKSRAEEWRGSLRVPDEIAAVVSATGLNTPGLEDYRPYFEAKRDWEEEFNSARLLTRKLNITVIDMSLPKTPGSEIVK